MPEHDLNNWSRWQEHVLAELKRLNEGFESLRKELLSVKIEMVAETSSRRAKSSVWGVIGGFAAGVVLHLIEPVSRLFGKQ